MLPDDEGQVVFQAEFEMRREDLLQSREGTFGRGATDPVDLGREFFQPGERGGEQKLAAGFHEGGQAAQEPHRLGQAANQVRGEYDV